MRYLLDTNACRALLNGSPPSLADRVLRHTSSEHGINGGEGGIRTRVGVTNPLTAFEAAPL